MVHATWVLKVLISDVSFYCWESRHRPHQYLETIPVPYIMYIIMSYNVKCWKWQRVVQIWNDPNWRTCPGATVCNFVLTMLTPTQSRLPQTIWQPLVLSPIYSIFWPKNGCSFVFWTKNRWGELLNLPLPHTRTAQPVLWDLLNVLSRSCRPRCSFVLPGACNLETCTMFASWSGQIFVIVVVHIQCSKLFKAMECAVLSMVLCTIKNPWSHLK